MKLTVTELRANLYNIVDQIINTGIPVEIERNHHKIKIILADGPSKLDRLVYRDDVVNGDIETLVHSDWLSEWSELKGDK
jgi:hypothetical protein